MALPRTYASQNCSVARSLEVVGDRWTMLVIRSAFEGVRRFDDFQDALGVARNVLADRLGRLCDEGVLRRVPYQERPERYEYRLTRKGVELWPTIMTLLHWGDRHYAPDGPPAVIVHRGCGGAMGERLTCASCGARLEPSDVEPRPGPGA
ncbi:MULTISPECIES: winged helix-turn-helix transcriptional regulator [Thermomonosporaceae]|uniref:winged helix-turn-helix transcriptional regulator n=1 Tax=Thermomonosporaceae TaxID=2012 RepID=UPI00255B275C|nr:MULTISPECIES: helix-turn-helix domain-containing protein [Thermomonosporaceae]MDL4773696.1 helix-turn-helix domain-containing protein [Actinomadura xylanilytica]